MKRLPIVAAVLAVALVAGLAMAQPSDTPTTQIMSELVTATPVAVQVEDAPVLQSLPEQAPLMSEAPVKKCGFDSDCKFGKCKKGVCGGCGFDSDCKGWGKCKKGQCGGCGFDSDCKGHGKCSSGKCTKSPYK